MLKRGLSLSSKYGMLSHNYDVAGCTARSEVKSPGSDLYKPTLTAPPVSAYVWTEEAQSLSEILKDSSLPLVVRLCNDNMVNEKDTPVDLGRPLLLYREVNGTKLHARNLQTRPALRDVGRTVFHSVGPYVTFPDSFPGFFKPMDSRDEPLSTIADVGRLMSKSFISVQPCQGFVCLSELKDILYQKTTLPAGLYWPSNILEGSITYLNKRKCERKKLVRCLHCHDEKGKKVLFPMDTKGGFYISELNSKFSRSVNIDSACRAYKWTEFDETKLKGLRVRMLHRQVPQQNCHFTGYLEFCYATPEHTVIGVTMTTVPRLFEMAVTSEPFFVRALNSKDFESGTLQQMATKLAKNECEAYMQTIKVKKDYDIDQAQC